MRRPRRLLHTSAVVLSVVAAACSSAGVDDRAATEPESRTSSTLPPSPSAAAAVGVRPSGAAAAVREAPTRAPRGKQGGTRPPGSSPAPVDAQGSTSNPTTLGTSPPSTSTTVPPGLPAEKCPDAKTCRRYRFLGNAGVDASRAPRWPVGGDGFAVVRYHVNPLRSELPQDDVRGAVERAFETIARAAPALRFEFAGFTDRLPMRDDGYNDIGFANASTAHALPRWQGTTMTEVDMLLGAGGNWTWSPCEQRDGSCTPVCVRTSSGTGCRSELQSTFTHEGLHWAGLGDMSDDETDRELSASPRGPFYDRFHSTLALGDVLGLRALYPCSCPLAAIYAP